MELKESLYSIHFKEYLQTLSFGYKDSSHFIMGGTDHHIIVWNLLNCDVIWTTFLLNPRLFTHPESHLIAVTSYEGHNYGSSLFIFDPKDDKPIKTFAGISKSSIIDACFLRNGKDLNIYILNEEHTLYKICKEEKFAKSDDTNTSSTLANANYSVFDGLLQGPKFDTSQKQLNIHSFKQIDTSLIENPPHILPPPKLYCWSIISKLLQDTKNSNVEVSKKRPSKNDEDEMELDALAYKEISHKAGEQVSDIPLSTNNTSNVHKLDFTWLDSFFRSKEYSIVFD